MATVEQIDACLPQTQCTQCTYPGCLEYAQAIKDKQADINQCPPGGAVTINALAGLLDRLPKPLNNDYGEHKPKRIAKVIEKDCIGCMLCIKACPVDAIIGSNKFMHSVIDLECTGCELCLPVCPMDCIELIEPEPRANKGPWKDYSQTQADIARLRRQNRLKRIGQKSMLKESFKSANQGSRQQAIQDAIKRARNKRP